MRPSKNTAYARLHFVVFLWGFTAILGNLISISAIPLVWHRMGLAAVCIFLFLLFTRRTDFKIDKKAWRIILAGSIIAAHWITFFHSIKISNVSVTLACASTGAFFGSIIEPIVYRRKINLSEIMLGSLVVIGLYLIFRFEGNYTEGIIVGLISALLAAFFSVINSKLVQSHSPIRITFLEMLGGWLVIGIFSVFAVYTNSLDIQDFAPSGTDWIYIFILGSVCTAYAFIESVAVMKILSPFTVLLSINLEPVYGILLALIIFGESERMNPFFYVGASTILLTVFIDAFLKRRRKKKGTATIPL